MISVSVEARYPPGPFLVAGYSLGGVIAFQVGKALEKRGKDVVWVGVLDLAPPYPAVDGKDDMDGNDSDAMHVP